MAEVRQYSTLFADPEPLSDPERDLLDTLNPDSLRVVEKAYVEPGLVEATPGTRFQFMRLGYYCVDQDSTPEQPVFNLTVSLKDTWAKMAKAPQKK